MNKPIIPNEQYYLSFLNDVKTEIRKTRINVAKAANRELIELY